MTGVLLFLFVAAWVFAAESGYRCGVCDRKIERGTVWTLAETNYICDACHTIPQRCIHCSMPVKIGFATTSDGRVICRRHVPLVVLDEREAGAVFRSATEELRRIARGGMELRQTDIPVKLFDTDYWNSKEDRNNPDALHKVGFSSTTTFNGLTNHSVVMLSGQLQETLAAVSAHEYTHLWINENRPTNHIVEPDTVEAICELAAWKLMDARNDRAEQARIEANLYTKGRIKQLIAVDHEIGFTAVLDWVKNGTGSTLSAGGPTSTSAPSTKSSAGWSVWQAAIRAPRSALPAALRLDGIVEGKDRTVALVNGVTVQAGGAAEVRLESGVVRLMVESITNGTVVLRTNGHPDLVTLKLEDK